MIDEEDDIEDEDEDEEDEVVPKSWLQNWVTVEEAEARHSRSGIPFGYQNDKWTALKGKLLEGDELWEFCSSPQSWRDHAGRAGIALVRNGIPIKYFITLMN